MSTQQLVKGANAPVAAARLMVVLSWSGGLDLDVAALLLGPDGKVRSDDDFIFYNQPHHYSGCVQHLGKTGGSSRRDSLGVSLASAEPEIERIVISASTHTGTFAGVSEFELTLLDGTTDAPLLSFPIVDATVETAMVTGELYRRNGTWKFRAVGQGYAEGLRGLATDYGISVEDESELAPEAPAAAPPSTPNTVVASYAPSPPAPPVPVEVNRPVPAAVVPSQPTAATPQVGDDAEVTLQPFATPNPYLRKLFTMKEFGRAPGRALDVYRQRVIDPDEKMLAAFKSQHGRMRWGYLILTTHYVRWIQTVPLQAEEMYEYNDRIEQEGTMIRFPTGDQFQLKGFGGGRKFKAVYQVAQQGYLWE